jgi:hypothetical protein
MEIRLVAIDCRFAMEPSDGKRFLLRAPLAFEAGNYRQNQVNLLVQQLATCCGIGDHVVQDEKTRLFTTQASEPGKEFSFAVFVFIDDDFDRDLTIAARRAFKELDRGSLLEYLT